MKINWFWKWLEKVLRKSAEKRRIIVRIVEFLNRKKAGVREKVYDQLQKLWHRAMFELDLDSFLTWVEVAYYRSASGGIDDVRLKLMAQSIDIMKNGKEQTLWELLLKDVPLKRKKRARDTICEILYGEKNETSKARGSRPL